MTQLIKSTDLTMFSSILESIYVVSNSEYSGSDSICEQHKQKLQLLIPGCDIIQINEETFTDNESEIG